MVEVKSNPEALDEAHTDDVKHTMLHENLFFPFNILTEELNLICGFTAASFLVL